MIFRLQNILMNDRNQSHSGLNTPALLIQTAIQQPQKDADNKKRMPNGFRSSKYFKRYIDIERIFIIAIILQVLIIFAYYEVSIQETSQFGNLLLYILLGHSIICSFINILKDACFNDWKASQLKQYQSLSRNSIFLQTLFVMIGPYPFLQKHYLDNWDYSIEINLQMKLNYLLIILSYLKVVLLIESAINLTKFKNPRASRVCTIYGCDSSKVFAIKCYFIETPIKMITIALVSAMLIFTFAFRVAENHREAGDNPLKLYQNSLWLVIITMTSVGYGQLSPRTQWGRVIGFICTFCGVLIVSVMVLVVINTFQMSKRQYKSLNLLNKVQERHKLKEKAGIYIRNSLWRLWKNYKSSKIQSHDQRKSKQQLKTKIEFSERLRESKFIDNHDLNIGEQMERQFQKVNDYLEKLDGNCDSMIRYMSQNYFVYIQNILHSSGYARESTSREIKFETQKFRNSKFIDSSHTYKRQ